MLPRLVLSSLRPHRAAVVIIVLAQLTATFAALALPSLNADIIDKGVVAGNLGKIWSIGALMLIVSLLQFGCTAVAYYYGSRTSQALGRDLRHRVFFRVQRFSAAELSTFGAASLITRVTNDIRQIQALTNTTFLVMITAPLMALGGVIMSLRQDTHLSVLLVITVPVLAIIMGTFIHFMRPLFRIVQRLTDRLTLVMREHISGARVVRAFNRQRSEHSRFDAASRELRDTQAKLGYLLRFMFPLVNLTINMGTVAVVWFGALRIADDSMTPGAMIAFLAYLMQIMMAVLSAFMVTVQVPRAEVAAERITEVLDTVPEITDPDDPVELPGRCADLEMQAVSFAFPGAANPVLDDISVRIPAGSFTAIIGSTGAGKSTALNLLTRLIDPTRGVIRIGGVDISTVALTELRRYITYIPQVSYLLSGTLRQSLTIGSAEVSDERIWRALSAAQVADDIRALPDGLETVIESGGQNFSGGQRQRLAIARALVRGGHIYLFDDSFSALDFATDAAVRAALPQMIHGASVVVVGQRVSTIRHADQIVVLDKGRIVSIGRHRELVETCPTYREIVRSQEALPNAAGPGEGGSAPVEVRP